MPSSEASSSSPCQPLVRCRQKEILSSPNHVNDEAGSSRYVVPSLVDEDWSDEGSPNAILPVREEEEKASSGADDKIVELNSPVAPRERGKRQRAPRRKAVKDRGEEYFKCDNDSGIYPSWCTEESISKMRSYCRVPEEVEIVLPGLNERPWDCPKGYVCLYESFFLEGGLWFPLPNLLVDYCRERMIAFSQLTTKSICHIIGILVLSVEAGVEIDYRFIEEVCQIKTTRGRIFYVSARTKFELITHARGDNIKNWQRFYFFAKIDDFSSGCHPKFFYKRWIRKYGRF